MLYSSTPVIFGKWISLLRWQGYKLQFDTLKCGWRYLEGYIGRTSAPGPNVSIPAWMTGATHLQ